MFELDALVAQQEQMAARLEQWKEQQAKEKWEREQFNQHLRALLRSEEGNEGKELTQHTH